MVLEEKKKSMKNLKRKIASDFYLSPVWKRKRLFILMRDHYVCQRCKEQKDKISIANTVHHIKHLKEYPDLALEDSNLISVCDRCHNELHPEKRIRKQYEEITRVRVIRII